MREIFARLTELGFRRHQILKALPVCAAPQTLQLYNQNRKKYVGQLKVKAAHDSKASEELKKIEQQVRAFICSVTHEQ